jgi:hypothetical protein
VLSVPDPRSEDTISRLPSRLPEGVVRDAGVHDTTTGL